MEKEQWEIERDSIINAFKQCPPQKGIKDDKERYQKIAALTNFRYRDKRCIYMLQKLIECESPCYMMGLLKYNWPILTTFNASTKRYFEKDVDNIIINPLFKEDITDLKKLFELFRKHYKDYSDCLLYIMSISDDGILMPYKKIGFSRSIMTRKARISLELPYEISEIKKWEIESNRLLFIERHIHKILNPHRKNGEWFRDPNDTLISLIDKELKHIATDHNIYIKEIINVSSAA